MPLGETSRRLLHSVETLDDEEHTANQRIWVTDPGVIQLGSWPIRGLEACGGQSLVCSASRRYAAACAIAALAAFVSRSALSMTKSWMMPW